MPSERVQRQIDQLLDEIESARGSGDWTSIRSKAEEILDLDPENADASGFLAAALRRQQRGVGDAAATKAEPPPVAEATATQPTSFANGRYTVTRFLGEGGKKKVYLARDSRLDRDVAFALIKTEGLDEASRVRVQREAEAMGRLGAHPHIVTVFDIGEQDGQPYLVLPVLAGGDVEGVIEKAPENKLTIERAVKIAVDTCLGLEFAHSKGIVHRDLKPGNIWLTEDGRAMIGDFGLAVAVDKSRLTQAGMMVGTVSYMPPEQAMGGEVGPRSDLYSLGAMLYEMVCGRPPFVGDESVAIIGQHLNTPPVAPSWHRPDCPPALETLILRLLEKDPSNRPASAEEVRVALESIGTVARPRDPTVASETPAIAGDNPLYRRTFVGRENEVRQLQQAFDAALSGQGGLVMVVGEPGIGKTALCEQLATYVALRGGKALVGHCYEEGSLSLPYLAFVEAMRSYVLTREPDGLRSDLGTGAADVARIVSEVRDRVEGVELRVAGDPEDDRWRLLQAVTSFLRNASTVQPLCIVLEDLHWADRGSLDLLLHVSRNLPGARLLIVGTYRDVEVDRSHPLSGTLADLRRGANFTRVPLRGLTVDEVHRMFEAIRGQATPWGQAEAVHRQTEGNPLFVQEVLRYLVEEGIVVREDGRYVAQGGEGVGIPEGLRDVVGRRLSRLSDKTNQVLAVAAVMGRDFRLDILQRVAGISDSEVETALQEAQERAIIESRPALGALGFRFSHTFFRQTLYEEIFASRRLRLHQQVARALEDSYGRRLEDHASELAEHFAQSTDAVDLEKALHYSELAAQRATQVFDYGEAVRHLEEALKVLEVLDTDDKTKRCDLLLALGEALLPAGEPRRAGEQVAEEAFAISEGMRDAHRASLACWTARRAFGAAGNAELTQNTDQQRRWVERADRWASDGTADRVRADLFLAAFARNLLGDEAQSRTYGLRALDLATKLGDTLEIAEAAAPVLNAASTPPEHHDGRLRVAQQITNVDFEGIGSTSYSVLFTSWASTLLTWGDRGAAEELWRRRDEHAARAHDAGTALLPLISSSLRLTLDGRLMDALATAEQIAPKALEAGRAAASGPATGQATRRALLYLGRAEEALAGILQLPDFFAIGGVYSGQRALCLAHAGRLSEAQAILDRFKAARDLASHDDTTSAAVLRYLIEPAVLCADKELASALVGRFESLAGLLHTEANMTYCVGRLIGEAAVLLDRPSEARGYYGQGLEISERVRFRPEIALIHLDLAELLLAHYPDERDAAIEHLDFAIAELRDMKMQPALERALRHRGLLKA